MDITKKALSPNTDPKSSLEKIRRELDKEKKSYDMLPGTLLLLLKAFNGYAEQGTEFSVASILISPQSIAVSGSTATHDGRLALSESIASQIDHFSELF